MKFSLILVAALACCLAVSDIANADSSVEQQTNDGGMQKDVKQISSLHQDDSQGSVNGKDSKESNESNSKESSESNSKESSESNSKESSESNSKESSESDSKESSESNSKESNESDSKESEESGSGENDKPTTLRPTRPTTTKRTRPTTTPRPTTTKRTRPTTTQRPTTTKRTRPTTTPRPTTTKRTRPTPTTTASPAPTSERITTQAPTTTSTTLSPPDGDCDVVCRPGDHYLVNPVDCNSFYQCSNGVPILQPCPEDLIFDPTLNVCNRPEDSPPCKPSQCLAVTLHYRVGVIWVARPAYDMKRPKV